MSFWCPNCGDALRMTTPEDLECRCGFFSRKIKERRFEGEPVWTESYRVLKKVYEWDPPVLLKSPEKQRRQKPEWPEFDPDLFPRPLSIRQPSREMVRETAEERAATREPLLWRRSESEQIDEEADETSSDVTGKRMHKEADEIPLDVLGLTAKLTRGALPTADVRTILGDLIGDARRLGKFASRAIKYALSTSEPLVTAIVLAENIRRVKPDFLMTPRETTTMPRFIAKVLVSTTDYNLKVDDETEYRILEEGTRFLFACEPPSPRTVFREILKYDKGIESLANNPQALLALQRICDVFFECTLEFEDILGKVMEQLDTEIADTNAATAQSEPDEQNRLLQRSGALQFYKAAIEVLRQGMAPKEPL